MDRTTDYRDRLPINAHEARPQAASADRGAEEYSRKDRPRIGVIYNPRSHRNRGQDLDGTHNGDITVVQPRTREDIATALTGFGRDGIDYLIINGGDGTVRDVLTMGQGAFGDDWPVIAVLPKGKTNALNVDLGAPSGWSLPDAITAYETGRRIRRRPLSVWREGSDRPALLGFIFGAGTFTLGIEAGQDAHRLGFFNSLAVGATSVWGVIQSMLGRSSNKWRRGTEMTLNYLPSGEPVQRSNHGEPNRRLIILASTLQRFPMGLKMFGAEREGLKLAVLDRARRRVFAALPAICLGWRPGWLEEAGYHQLDADGFTIDVAEPVILDGEAFPPGRYRVEQGPELTFVTT